MKRSFLIIVFTMLFVSISSVFAANMTEITNSNNTGDIKIIYTVSDSYLVSIPEAFDLIAGEEVSRTIYAEDVCIGYGMELQLTVSGANCSGEGENRAWYIVDEEEGNENNRYEYTIGTESGLADVKDDGVVLTVLAGDTNGDSQDLFFNLKDEVTKSGTYSDTLTFSVGIVKSETQEETEPETPTGDET